MVDAIVCDLDGSLMNPSSGIYVKEIVRDALIEVKKGRTCDFKFGSLFSRCVSAV